MAPLFLILEFCSVSFSRNVTTEQINSGLRYSDRCVSDMRKCSEKTDLKECIQNYSRWKAKRTKHDAP